ncbi:MAG: alpha/beta hydrolase-fold protein [Tractidigestivibacter sp.]|jgi:enterochelin esterase-like enzyme/acetyl esterase/lipase|uniref:alpha/beta hydrolase-fold protein n=1 Tax=Tractidigestivibacter sp. TaxID=2847320 RepID=UPI003D8CCC32
MSRRSFIGLAGAIGAVGLGLSACSGNGASDSSPSGSSESISGEAGYDAGQIPTELEYVPDGYDQPADHAGTLERLDYQTYESFSYAQGDLTQPLSKTAWVYVPYGYTDQQRYDILYLSHGGWSNETTLMGTPDDEHTFKHIVDHAIEDGLIEPLLVVLPTYNNTSGDDSGDYSLALKLTDNFHNELVNDLMPAAESRWSTYAEDTTLAGFAASRDHRGFAGFSMGSVNTWHTFEYCLDYFRWFMPMSGAITSDGATMTQMVSDQGHTADDFFIYSMSGTDDFAYSSISGQISAMEQDASGTFHAADSLADGNIAFREREGYSHNGTAANEYTYNGMRLFFNGPRLASNGEASTSDAAWYSVDTPIDDVKNDPALGDWGRLIFPVDEGYMSGSTLGDLDLTWYSEINPEETVAICNYLRSRAEEGSTPFMRFYTDDEISADPDKADTGLFFFRGNADGRVAFCCAGGGFAYVGAIHDSMPHALELSRKGYNAFAIIYRPGAQTACEDLSRAIAYVQDHADELGLNHGLDGYSIWGGSAGARMADWVGTYGTEYFSGEACPKPSAIVMQYTGLSEVTGDEPPTYACVGTSDYIADWQTMSERISRIQANGTPAEIEVFNGLSHGFGLGTGTVAEGWLDRAAVFWDEQS